MALAPTDRSGEYPAARGEATGGRRPRLDAIIELASGPPPIVDVGCDHGHVSRALGAIGTERMPHRLPGRRGFRAVVADGLSPFGAVGTAVITGMGAATIARILEASPTPRVAVLHAPDRPDALRRWCASHGWRIDAEMLAPEGRRFAQVLRVVRGREPHHGHLLAFGPRLRHDPNLEAHARQCLHRWARIMEVTRHRDPTRSEEAQGWVAFLHDVLQGTAWSHQPPA